MAVTFEPINDFSNSKEYYKCKKCGKEFVIDSKERLTTFIYHQPDVWTCPDCGQYCFCLKKSSF